MRWVNFLQQYARERPQLRMIVHLIDGEIGPQETDLVLMRMIREAAADELPAAVVRRRVAREQLESEEEEEEERLDTGHGAGGWQYAVVLTKVDKGGPKFAARAKDKVEKAIEETGCPTPAAIVVTSASRKIGRVDMWRMFRRIMITDEGQIE